MHMKMHNIFFICLMIVTDLFMLQETSNFANHCKGKKDKKDRLRESQFVNKGMTEIPTTLSQSKISQLNTTLGKIGSTLSA